MAKQPIQRTASFKFKLAIEALKNNRALTEIASEYELHPKQLIRWRDKLLLEGEDLFVHKATQKANNPDKEELLLIIKKLTLELEYLKKKLS